MSRRLLWALSIFCLFFVPQIEHLKACLEIATTRTINWQKFCQKDEGDDDVI